MRIVRVEYRRAGDLRLDLDGQIRRGGLLVQCAPPTDMRVGEQVTLEICAGPEGPLRFPAEVLYVQAGQCVAVSCPAAPIDRLTALCAGLPQQGAPPLHQIAGEAAPPAGAAAAGAAAPGAAGAAPGAAGAAPAAHASSVVEAAKRLEEMSHTDKIQLALHGNQDERSAILRDKNRQLHPFVLRNPQMSLEEVLTIAKNAQTGAELLEIIAGKKEWVHNPGVAMALVRNPRTAQAVGLRALAHVSPGDLRILAKGNCPPHISAAAKKKVLG